MDHRSTLFGIGYSAYGPILLRMLYWLVEEAKARSVDRLFFLAREGHVLKHLYDVFAALPDVRSAYGSVPPSTYLLTSRRACIGAMPEDPDDPEWVEIVLKPAFTGTLSELLERRIGIDPGFLEENGIDDRRIELPQDIPLVCSALRRGGANKREQRKQEREAYSAYLRAVELIGTPHAGLVDLGFSGTIQRCLHSITGTKMTGFYFATSELAARWGTPENLALSCFGTVNRDTGKPRIPVYTKSLLLEAWLTSPNGQLTRFELRDGVPEPVFAPPSSAQRHFATLMSLRDGAEAYIRDTIALCGGNVALLGMDCETPQKVFEHLLRHDTVPAEVQNYLVVEDEFCGNGEISVFELYRQREMS